MELDNLKNVVLSGDLTKDMERIKEIFDKDFTFNMRFINCGAHNLRFCLIFFDGMISNDLIDENIIRPLTLYDGTKEITCALDVANYVLTTDQANVTESFEDAVNMLLHGDSLLFMDGSREIIANSTKGFSIRGVDEPDGEKLVRGPREGFTESIMTNTSLIRRKLLTTDLKFDTISPSKSTKQLIAICYLESVVDKAVLAKLHERLKKVKIDTLLDSNCLTELIRDDKYSPFKTIGSTEKPDIAAAKLLEGKIVILVDGTPVAMTLPFLFLEYFQTGDDYYINYVYGTISRLLRILGFVLTISIPAVYLALVTYHYEIIPTKLLISISAARQGVPFPTFLEMILLLIAFELLREAGAMMPASVGQALSTVGAIVVGQAAVDARIVSAPMVIILALTGLTGMMSPKMQSPVLLVRLILLILAAILGLYGYGFGICVLIIYLMTKQSFGVPYMSYLTFGRASHLKDTLLRLPKNRNSGERGGKV